MKILRPPKDEIPRKFTEAPVMFLAGTCDKENWRKALIDGLKSLPCTLLDPTRDDYDKVQKNQHEYAKQVLWEQEGLAVADRIVMYFELGAAAPMSMYELGCIVTTDPHDLLLATPKAHPMRPYIEVLARQRKFETKLFDTLEALIDATARATCLWNDIGGHMVMDDQLRAGTVDPPPYGTSLSGVPLSKIDFDTTDNSNEPTKSGIDGNGDDVP